MDKEKVIHEIKRDLKSPMVFRGLIFISMLILILIVMKQPLISKLQQLQIQMASH